MNAIRGGRWNLSIRVLAQIHWVLATSILSQMPIATAEPAALRTLTGHTSAAISAMQPIARKSPSETLHLALSLPWRNPDQLQELLTELYNPSSTGFRKFLTPSEFTERFGPTVADYQKLKDYVRAQGLTITGEHPNRMLLDVSGPVATIEKAFGVALNVYQHPVESRTFISSDREPSVPADVPLLDISGLSNFELPKSKGYHRISSGTRIPQLGSGPHGGDYTAKDLRAAYASGLPATSGGQGQSVGLLEFDGFYTNDIAKYRQYCGLANVPIRTVMVNGFSGVPTTGSNSGNGEVALDIQMVMALAPSVAEIVVYESDPSYGLANDLLSRMANDVHVLQLSSSWTFGSAPSAATKQLFQQFAAQGQSFFDASGDSGSYYGVSIPTPDDSPYITLVGGTTLSTRGPMQGYLSETVWNNGSGGASSGGISTTQVLPAWQRGVASPSNGASTSRRNIPDVALVGDNIYTVSDNGVASTVGGTSVSAPLWAGLAALSNQRAASVGQPPIGFLNPALYALFKSPSYATYFHDITQGNNQVTGSQGTYSAAVGYDLCTGIGTPVVSALVPKLAITDNLGITPFAGFAAHGPPGGPFDMSSQSLGLTNASNDTLSWAIGGAPSWLSVSSTSGVLPLHGSGTTVLLRLNPEAGQLPVGVATANLTVSNLTAGTVQTRTVTVSVGQNVVLNGGFETGDLTHWDLTGPSADVYTYVDNGTQVPNFTAHLGKWAASLGQNLAETQSEASLSQALPTLPGQVYRIGFWLKCFPDSGGVTLPNQFQAYWETTQLFSLQDSSAFNWTYHEFIASATSNPSVLRYDFSNDPGTWGLDDVTVTAIPAANIESVGQSDAGIQISWTGIPGVHYQVEFATDLGASNWTALGTPLVAMTSSLSMTDPSSSDAARFYRVLVRP